MKDWQFWGFLVAGLVAVAGAAWAVRGKIATEGEKTRKDITEESREAHKGITENINRVDGKVNDLSKEVHDTRVIVERIDTTLQERVPKQDRAPK